MRWSWWFCGFALMILIISAASGFSPETAQADMSKGGARRLIYQWEGGHTFVVEFAPQGESVYLHLPEKSLQLPAVPAASGAKYSDGQTTFWTKGEEAFIAVNGEIRYRGCQLKKE